MPPTNTPSKKSKPVLLRLQEDEVEELIVRAGQLQAAEKESISVQDVIRRALFPDRYPSAA